MMILDPKLVIEKNEPLQILREHCKNLVSEKAKREEEKRQEETRRKEAELQEVKYVLEGWLHQKFGYGKKPWRAIEGRQKIIRPIPFNWYECNRKWPEISKDLWTENMEALGFKVNTSLNGYGIVLSIPEMKKGEKLTWAQEKIKNLNHDYSMYVEDEKKLAQFIFKLILLELANYDIDKTEVCDDYILFHDYVFGETRGLKNVNEVSRKCYKFIKRLYRQNKVEEYFINGKYIGIKLYNKK